MELRGPDDRGDSGGGRVSTEGLAERGLENGEAGVVGYGVGAYTHHWGQDDIAGSAVNACTVGELEGARGIGVSDLPTADNNALVGDRREDLGNAGNTEINAGAKVTKDRIARADSSRLRSGWRKSEEEEGECQPEIAHVATPSSRKYRRFVRRRLRFE